MREQTSAPGSKRPFLRMPILLLVLGVFFAASPAFCNDYYVATDGDDGDDGSIDYPFATITQAVSVVVAGDTIYLRGGTHNYTSTISIAPNGSSSNYITMQNYQNETVIVDFSGQAYGSRGIEVDGNYWHLKGFTIQYAGDNGLYIAGSYNIAEQIVARMNSDSGIQLHEEGSYNLVLNCDSYENYDAPNNGENADGFAVKSDTIGPGNIFRGCRAWHNADDGFDLYYTQNAITFEDCWAFRNGENLWGASPWNGDGNGFKLGASSGNHVLIRCVAYDTWHNGIDINGDTLPVEVYNCTVVACGVNFYFDEPIASVLRNNISYLSSVNLEPEVDDQYNSWNPGFSVSESDFVSLDSTGIDGPRQADGSLPDLDFLRLAETSSLIDAGVDVGEPYEGDAPDLGAFEYTGGSVDNPPAAPTGLAATAGYETVSLDWDDNSESDLDGYNIYRSTTSGSGYVKQNGSLLSTSDYTDNSVTNDVTYYYVVTAVDANSNESDYSDEDSATPGDFIPPAAPVALTVVADDEIVWLDWDDNSESDLAGYNIYRSTTSGSGYTKLNGELLSSPEYDDSDVTNTITYYYVVTAVDTSSNESAYSTEVSATPAVYGDFIINGIVDVNDLDYLMALWLEDDCELTSEVDLGDDCIISFYEFSAFAMNWNVTEPDINAPAAPSNLSATSGDATVSLDWDDNSEGDLDGYNIYRSETSGSGYSKLNGSLLTASDYNDNTVSNGTTYYYVVTAVDTSSNESGYSNEDSATPVEPTTSITIQENETGFCGVDGTIDNNNGGYTGDGFANTTNGVGNGIDWRIEILSAGTYTFTWRYANGATDRPGDLLVNSQAEVTGISFPTTGNWTTWTTVSVQTTLTTGIKDVRLEGTGPQGLANIDYMQVTGPNLEAATCP